MKKTIILASAIVALMLASCGFGKSTSTNTSTTTQSQPVATASDAAMMGKNAGMALETYRHNTRLMANLT